MRVFLSLICAAGLLLVSAATFVFSPLYTAYAIREAVKTSDTDYLSERVSWPPVKQSLKSSLVAFTLGPGATGAAQDQAATTTGWWSRLKTAYGRSMVESMVERYANPEGFKTLFTYGRSVRRNVLGKADPDEGLSFSEKLAAIWSRIQRAEFITPSRFEIDMTDKYDPSRLYAGVLELHWGDWGWKLTELRVRQIKDAAAVGPESA
ncbi:MAG: DUF2939 domain-containing protein [Pseudomonadota bacterium]